MMYGKFDFMRALRPVPAIAVAAVLLASTAVAATQPATYKHGVIIDLNGEIGPGLEQYVFRKLDCGPGGRGRPGRD